MTPSFDSFARWLADYYLLSAALLVFAVVALLIVKQPAKRRAVTQSVLVGLIALAALCAIPGWSLISLTTNPSESRVSARPERVADITPLPFREGPGEGSPATQLDPIGVSDPTLVNANSPPPSLSRDIPWPSLAVFAWMTGAAFTLAWLALGLWAANRLIRTAQPAPVELLAILRDLERSNRRRATSLLTSSRIDVPVALGIWQPTVLLPTNWIAKSEIPLPLREGPGEGSFRASPANALSPADLRTVLAHEAAHLRNHDLHWLALTRALTVLLWANPLFWLLRRRLRLDQEALADAAAAELTSRDRYAERLVALAHIAAARPTTRLVSAVGLWEGPSQLRRRVAFLIDEHFIVTRNCSVQWRSVSLFAFALLAGALSLTTLQPAKSEPQPQPPEQPSVQNDAAISNDDLDRGEIIDDRFILCRVTTELQRSLLGDVSQPQSDASLCVFVNYAAFEGEQIEADLPALATLSERLATLATADNRGVLFHVLVSNDLPAGSVGDRAHSLARLCEQIGRRAGYKHSKWSTTWGVDPWKELVARADAAAKLGDSDAEQSVGNSQIRVFPVRTFLSRLLVNADCVVNVVPIIRQKEGSQFPDDFLPVIKKFVPEFEYDQMETMLMRVRYAASAEKWLEEWVNDRSSRKSFAKQFGFENCNLSQTLTNEEDAPPKKEEDAENEATDNGNGKEQPRPNMVAGRVVDENGKPLAGAEVFLFRTSIHDSSRKLVAQKVTDSDGRFQFDDVIDIAKEFPNRKFRREHDPRETFLQVIVRSPGKVSESWLHERYRVAQTGDFRQVTLRPAAKLRGRVTGPDGNPIAGALVSFGNLGPATWDGAMAARTDVDGDYEIDDIAPFDMQQYRDQIAEQRRQAEEKSRAGGYSGNFFVAPSLLKIEHPGFAAKRLSVEKIPGTQDVQLEPAAILQGRVVYQESGKPAVNALVEARTSVANSRTFDPDKFSSIHRAVTRTDENGNYSLTTLPAGTYDLSAELAGWVNVGISEVASKVGETVTVPDLTLSKGGVISARLVDSKTREPIDILPDTRADIAAHRFPLQALSSPVFEPSATANADQRFELRTPPGQRLILVNYVRVGDEAKWMGTSQLAEDSRIVVEVVEGETVEVDVPVIDVKEAAKATGTISGRFEVGSPNVRQNPRDVIEVLSKRLTERPDDMHALYDRAAAFERLGEYGNAVADYEKVIELQPDISANLIAHNNLAYLLSTASDESIRDGKRAVELAKKAQELGGQPFAQILDTLAAAYAESGDFEQAVKAQQQAIDMEPENANFRDHLKLYQAKQPLRDNRSESQPPKDDGDEDKRKSNAAPAAEQGSQFLRDLRAKAAPLLAAMAKEHGYSLEPGKDLARVAPPFAPIRMQYYRTAHPGQAKAIRRGPEAMVFRWVEDRLVNWGMEFGDPDDPGYSIATVLDALVDINSQNIDVPEQLLKTSLPGDWVVRPDADKARIIAQLQQILQNELSLPISLELREVKRRVYVARGKYQLTPLPGQRAQDQQTWADKTFITDEIQIFGKQLALNSGGGGGVGDFDEFLNWLGRWVGTPVVSDVENLPANKLSWHLHERSPSTDQTRAEDHDPKLVLANITAQTGLEFALEVRPVEILFVERSSSDGDVQKPQQ